MTAQLTSSRSSRPASGLAARVGWLALAWLAATAPGAPAATVTGTVVGKGQAPRKVAARYPGAGGGAEREVEPIPTVVLLEGPIPGAPASPLGRPATITQRDLSFEPTLLVVPAGTAVAFPNQDSELHNVFSYSRPKRFDLGRYGKGESKTVAFDRAGVVKVYCEIHPWMRAVVIVVENPFHAVVDAGGRFEIPGVPPGEHTLIAWNIDQGAQRVPITVTAAGAGELEVRLASGGPPVVRESTITTAATAHPATGPAPRPAARCCAGAEH